MRPLALVFALLSALAAAPAAHAQSADDQEARSLYEAGVRAYESGRYDRALEHFQRAYQLSPRPQLLYNIGQAADRLRHDREALDAFERYLASGQVEENLRAQIEGRIAVLRAEVAEDEARSAPIAETPESTPPSAPPHQRTEGPDLAPAIVLLAAGGAVAIGGGVMLGVAASEDSAVQNAPDGAAWSTYADRLDTANALAIGGGVALGVGVAAAVVGGVLLGTIGSGETTVAVGPGSVAVRGTF